MTLTDLRLQQYRSYSDASYELGEGVNIVVGPNAAGKTNLLESIMVNCTGKSYRARDAGLIQYDEDWARIDAHTSQNELRTVKIKLDTYGKTRKSFEIDGKEYKRLPQNRRLPVVLFEPNDLLLIESEPSLRRTYFDDVVEQYVAGYDKTRNSYKRVVSQRNALLKQGRRGESQLFAWNLRLSDLGGQLVTERRRLLESINKTLSETYSSIAGRSQEVAINYESSVDITNYGTSLLKKLEETAGLDIDRGFTSNGPHRDEFLITLNGKPALESASRGEIRTLLLSLKIIELKLLEAELGLRPQLLLDDVFSELDGARRRALTDFLKDYQTIITTTDADVVLKNFSEGYKIIPIS